VLGRRRLPYSLRWPAATKKKQFRSVRTSSDAYAYFRIQMCGERLARIVRAMRAPPPAG
jgi:hypothetical protein